MCDPHATIMKGSRSSSRSPARRQLPSSGRRDRGPLDDVLDPLPLGSDRHPAPRLGRLTGFEFLATRTDLLELLLELAGKLLERGEPQLHELELTLDERASPRR